MNGSVGSQDGVTQIVTNDHYKARGVNGKEQEKNKPVLMAELRMEVTLSFPPPPYVCVQPTSLCLN